MNYIPSRRLFLASVALAVLTLALLAGCALDPAPPPTPTPAPPTPTPLPRGGNLTIRLAADVPDLRPCPRPPRGEDKLTPVLYNALPRLDAKLQPQPDLATGWDASQDGRLITFTLRSDVTWHDGKPFSAEDAAYTLSALRELSPTTALLTDIHKIAQVEAPTGSTLVISLTERYAPIFADLAVPILPKHLLIGKDIATLDFWTAPIGTGPFQLADRQSGAAITLLANKRFFRGEPLLDRVALLVGDAQVATAALKDGRLLLAELPWSAGATISQTLPGIQAGAYPENGYYFMAFNTRTCPPFADAP